MKRCVPDTVVPSAIYSESFETVRLGCKSAAFPPKLPEKLSAWSTWTRGTTVAKAMLILALLLCFFFEPDDRKFEILHNVLAAHFCATQTRLAFGMRMNEIKMHSGINVV